MILVTGAITARPETFEEIRRLGNEHVRRSRLEPGCISHAMHVDCDNPLRLVFLERWRDASALEAHFELPASNDFVRKAGSLADGPTEISIYETTETSVRAIMK